MDKLNIDLESYAAYKQWGFLLAFAVMTTIQVLAPHHQNIKSDFKNWLKNLPLGFLNSIFFALTLGGLVTQLSLWVEAQKFGLFQWLNLPFIGQLIGALVVLDLVTYYWHRMNHRVLFLWRFHQVHHSDINFDTSTAVRFHIGELLISFCVRLIIIFIFGIAPLALLFFEIIYHICNQFEHGNIRLNSSIEKVLEKIIVTPALHRKHHSKKTNELDSNFATIFSFWDVLFKTQTPSNSQETFALGLPQQNKDYSMKELLLLPFKS